MKLPRIHIGRPQQLALLVLLFFFSECSWVVAHQQLSPQDYRFARCGREMWEQPSPLAGYFTTCGNLNGDGTFAYRAAGLPLTAQRLALQATDLFRKPEDRLYSGSVLNGSTWEARHQLEAVKYLLHLPFVFFAVWLGGGLWWVSRRLFGNEGGFLALGLYATCPTVIHYAVNPNNDVLAMWGLYGLIYTAIGVAHAMQGPRRKWRPRLALLTLALGLTACAHLLAAMLGIVAATLYMLWVAERNRGYVIQIPIFASLGALAILFASYSFRLQAFSYVFTGGGARFWFSLDGPLRFIHDPANWPILAAFAVALILYLGVRRSRYFGNTAPLLMLLALLPIQTTQVIAAPWFWALPFLFTFVGGTFADALETRQRRLFLVLSITLFVAQTALCLLSLPVIARS